MEDFTNTYSKDENPSAAERRSGLRGCMLMLQTEQQNHPPGLNSEGLEAQQAQVTPSGSLTSDRAVRRAPITSAASACPPFLSWVVGYSREGQRRGYVVHSGTAGCTVGLMDLALLQLVRGISLPVTLTSKPTR